MRWQIKAAAMRVASVLPRGEVLYQWGQTRVGRLASDPRSRLEHALGIAQWLREGQSKPLPESVLVELGSGHVPLVPLYLWLLGAREVWTLDLNRRLNLDLTRETMEELLEVESDILPRLIAASEDDGCQERWEVLRRMAHDPQALMREARIIYRAPADAASTTFLDHSVDVIFSVTVLEHIPPQVLTAIFLENRRTLRPDGCMVHFVDPSDHFQHQDPSISSINFLKYSDRAWSIIGGNEYAYCNRLRASQLEALIIDAGFALERVETSVDAEAVAALRNGFKVDPGFRGLSAEDLCATSVRIFARPK